ncbi:MAG: thiamine phosphate synthase [Nitrospirae bacterium]|nr:thiamine phosphate synthase [Nitrospirota bacterium]
MTPFVNNNPLYLITDRIISGLSLTEIVKQAIAAGVRTIQIREKNLSKKKLFTEVLSMKTLFRKHRALLIINDYVDITLAADADGVHLGHEDMPIETAREILGKKKIIGISTHTLKQALEAERAGADYIGFGPIFHTATKDTGRPKGINALIEIKNHVKIPLVAIGGITPENCSRVLATGANAIAVVSGILVGDIKTNTREFLKIIKNSGGGG